MADKTTAYFRKIVLTTEIRRSNGEPIRWINAGWQTGVLETSDPKLIEELTAYAKREVGGVTIIDQATFEDLKKNSSNKSPRPGWSPNLTAPLPAIPQSPKEPSEKPSKSDAAAKKPAAERSDKPATATGVFSSESP